MPYKLFKDGKGRHCVKNTETGESKGCSDSEEMARAHMRAMYAHEKKELAEKELDDLVESSIEAEPCETCGEDKEVKLSIIDQIKSVVKELLPGLFAEKEQDASGTPVAESSGLMVWKEESGDFRWIARFSNNFRDDDNPPEIISKESHLRFIDRVEKGLAPYPVLELWHRPEWKIGQADFLAADEVGDDLFTIASGTFDADKKEAAEWLMSVKEDIRVSHGMPVSTIKRDEKDPTIIIEHETREISPLPDWAAANKLTGFVFISSSTKEDEMAIPSEKREKLIKQWGADPALLDRLEALNASDASAAKEAGVESKEKTEVAETPVENKDAVEETVTETAAVVEETVTETAAVQSSEVSQTNDFPTRQEVADAVSAVLQPFIERFETFQSALEELGKEVKEVSDLKRSEDERLSALVKESSQASLVGMMTRAIGSPETVVRKDARLAASKPKEAAQVNSGIGIPFIDKMLGGSEE